MRRLSPISICALVWLASGCTASDRDYVRNHIVLLENQNAVSSSRIQLVLEK